MSINESPKYNFPFVILSGQDRSEVKKLVKAKLIGFYLNLSQ